MRVCVILWCFFFFFFNDTPATEIYTLSLHDALPILEHGRDAAVRARARSAAAPTRARRRQLVPQARRGLGAADGARSDRDRKSTRLNSSHSSISYAVFCLKKKKKKNKPSCTP